MSTNNINFKSCESLFNKIKEDFESFDNSNLIDEGRFYSDVKYVIAKLGISWYRSENEILEVEDFKTKLPDNFHLLEYALKLKSLGLVQNYTPGIVLSQLNYDKFVDVDSSHRCDPCKLEKSCNIVTQQYITVQRPIGLDRCLPQPLKLGNVASRKYCEKACELPFVTSEDTISLDGKFIYTNFREGSIYIDYTAFPIDEDGLPMIPDNIHVEKAIEYYIKMNLIEKMWTNSDADVAQKVQYYSQQFDKYMGNATNETKTPSFNNMVNTIRSNRKRHNIYQIR